MEKFYIVTNEKYLDELDERDRMHRERNVFIKKFFSEKGIDGGEYILHGSGSVGKPFCERDKSDIGLCIEDTKNNNELFGTHFKKGLLSGLREFKKSSKLLKEFQDRCINEQVVINLPRPRVGDSFKEFEYRGYSYSQFRHSDKLYLSISNNDVDAITPKVDGFNEIAGSEFYKAKEEYEALK